MPLGILGAILLFGAGLVDPAREWKPLQTYPDRVRAHLVGPERILVMRFDNNSVELIDVDRARVVARIRPSRGCSIGGPDAVVRLGKSRVLLFNGWERHLREFQFCTADLVRKKIIPWRVIATPEDFRREKWNPLVQPDRFKDDRLYTPDNATGNEDLLVFLDSSGPHLFKVFSAQGRFITAFGKHSMRAAEAIKRAVARGQTSQLLDYEKFDADPDFVLPGSITYLPDTGEVAVLDNGCRRVSLVSLDDASQMTRWLTGITKKSIPLSCGGLTSGSQGRLLIASENNILSYSRDGKLLGEVPIPPDQTLESLKAAESLVCIVTRSTSRPEWVVWIRRF